MTQMRDFARPRAWDHGAKGGDNAAATANRPAKLLGCAGAATVRRAPDRP